MRRTKIKESAANTSPKNSVLTAIIAYRAVLVRLAEEGLIEGTVMQQNGLAQLAGGRLAFSPAFQHGSEPVLAKILALGHFAFHTA